MDNAAEDQWIDIPTHTGQALNCPCCTPNTYAAPAEETDPYTAGAYETTTYTAPQVASWARAIALESAATTGPATLGEHIDTLILKLKAIADGDEPLRLDQLPDEV